jgi:hypothetical protein
VFLKETSFHGVMLAQMVSGSTECKRKVHDFITEGIATGAVRPLPRTVFLDTEVEQAFRYSCYDADKLVREIQRNMLPSSTTTAVIRPVICSVSLKSSSAKLCSCQSCKTPFSLLAVTFVSLWDTTFFPFFQYIATIYSCSL